jgi:hypothetical protein
LKENLSKAGCEKGTERNRASKMERKEEMMEDVE